jgi:hypothetical protein
VILCSGLHRPAKIAALTLIAEVAMSSSIPPVSPAGVEQLTGGQPPKPSAANSNSTASHEMLRQNAALNQVLAEYDAEVSAGQPAGSLNPLAQQITGIAAELGEAVSIPQAPGVWSKPPATAADTSPAAGDAGRLNTLA